MKPKLGIIVAGLLMVPASAFSQEPVETPPVAVVDFSNPPPKPSSGADTEGFFFEFCGNSNHLGGVEDREPGDAEQSIFLGENAPGGTIVLAYGFTPSFPVRLSVSGAEHNTTDPDVDVQFSSVTLEGAYVFRAGTPVRPYVYGGFGGFRLKSRLDEFDYEATGPGIDVGVGLYSFLGSHFVFDAALRFDFVNWETETARVDLGDGNTAVVERPLREEGSAAKILLGIGWWF